MARKRASRIEPGSDGAFGLTDLSVMHLPEFLDVLEAAGATVDRFEHTWQYPISERAKITAAVQAWLKQREAA